MIVVNNQIINVLCILILISATSCVLLARFIPHLNPLLKYGKVLKSNSKSETAKSNNNNNLYHILLDFTVPKHWFLHFYILLFSSCCVSLFYFKNNSLNTIFLVVQGFRRMCESYRKTNTTSSAQMHITHYLIGLIFYTIQSISTFTLPSECNNWPSCISITVFTAASILQSRAHAHLSSLKKYTLPYDHFTLFHLISSPHYLAEMAIYLSLCLNCTNFTLAWTSLVWVVVNLSVTAEQTLIYYNKRFQSDSPPYAVIPYVF